jgi:hypothetical protein
MANTKISALTSATTPLAGTEVLPIVQSGATVKVSVANLTVARDVALKTVTATAAATQDGVALAGRAGGTSSYIATITPTTLSANCTVTLPNANTSIPVATQTLTFSGPTAARTITLPDANFTAARTDAAQSFTGNQTLSTGNLVIGTSGKGIDFSATPSTGTSELFADYEEGTWTPAVAGVSLTTPLGTYTKIGNKVYANFTFSSTAAVSASSFLISGLPFTPNTVATEADRPAGYLTYNGSAAKSWTLLFGSGITTVAFRQDPGGATGTITDLSGLTLWGTIIYTST